MSSRPHQFVSISQPEWESGKDRHRCASRAADYGDPVHIRPKWPLIIISADCFVPQWAGEIMESSRNSSTDANHALILALAVLEECNLRRDNMKLSSNLRYRVVGVEHDMSQLRALKGVSCGHTWKGFGWGNCPRCGDAPADNPDDRYHWLDRKTNRPLTYKDGKAAQFNSLDGAIAAFVNGELEAERNEVLT